MPQVHVVSKRTDLESLAGELISSRASAATRRAAVDALRAANPGLDPARIDRGTVVLVPAAAGATRVEADPVEGSVTDLVDRVRAGVDALVAASASGEERRTADKQATQRVLSRAAVRRAAEGSTRVAESVEEVRANLKEADAEGRRTASRLAASRERWDADLDGLAALLRGR